MSINNLIYDNVWLLFIFVAVSNAFSLKARYKKIVEEQPELQESYKKIFMGYLLFMLIPWVVMGIGIIFGGVPNVFSFLRPKDGNLFVYAFHASIVVIWLLNIWWVYFKGGAEFLATHPGVFGYDIKSPLFIKIFNGLGLIGGALALAFMWRL